MAGLGADELVQVAGRDVQPLRIAGNGIEDPAPVEKQFEEPVDDGMGLGLAGRRNRIEEQVERAGEVTGISPGERGDHPVHDLGDEGGAVEPIGAHDRLSARQERVGYVPKGGQGETARIADDVGVMMDGERYVGRNQQQLAAAAQAGFAVDVREDLPFQEEQESETRQGCARDFRRFHGQAGLHPLDEKALLGPIAPLLPIWNDSFHGNV